MISSLNSPAAITTAGAADAPVPQPRLVRAAHEFEAQMMKELMKPMTSASSSLTGDEEDADSSTGSSGALGQFASEALARALSDQGGLGIANQIVKELSHSGNQEVTGNPHGNTVMRTLK
jgi:Rod binding domain-containing protein